MKKSCLLLWLCCSYAWLALSNDKVTAQLKELAKAHQYILMDSLNQQIRTGHYYYYKAKFANVCNQPMRSNAYLDTFQQVTAEGSFELLKMRNDNAIKLGLYAIAYQTAYLLITQYPAHFDKQQLEEERNSMYIWEALSKQKPQAIASFEQCTLSTQRDAAGLLNTVVAANDTQLHFVFDTGAGLSCITASNAQRLGLQLLPSQPVTVQSFGGQKNTVQIGIAPELYIGSLLLKHVVFLVYPDSAFSFGGGAYTINGIIGFPVASALGTIEIEEGRLTAYKSDSALQPAKNFFVDQLRAIIMLEFQGKKLPFNFDTGGQKSVFSKSFYDLFAPYIHANAHLKKHTTAGAGAQAITKEVYVLNNQQLLLNGMPVTLPAMHIDAADYDIYGPYNYGNIGQDLLQPYKKVILSFDHNYLQLLR